MCTETFQGTQAVITVASSSGIVGSCTHRNNNRCWVEIPWQGDEANVWAWPGWLRACWGVASGAGGASVLGSTKVPAEGQALGGRLRELL